MTEVVIVSGARTAIGTFGGSLIDVPVVELGALVIKEAVRLNRGAMTHRQCEVVVAPELVRHDDDVSGTDEQIGRQTDAVGNTARYDRQADGPVFKRGILPA